MMDVLREIINNREQVRSVAQLFLLYMCSIMNVFVSVINSSATSC